MRGNTNFINALKQPVKVVDAELVIDDDINLSGEDINSVRFEYESELFTAVMTKLTIVVKLINATSSDLFAKKGKTITDCTLKASYLDGWATMSITDKYGEYVITDVTIDGKENTATLVCYDRMINTMKPFELDNTFPSASNVLWTMTRLISYIAGKLGFYWKDVYERQISPLITVTSHNMIKGNWNTDLLKKRYFAEDGTPLVTYRDVLNDIAQVIASNFVIDVYYDETEQEYIPWLNMIPVGELENITYNANKLVNFDYSKPDSELYNVTIISSDYGELSWYGEDNLTVPVSVQGTYQIYDNPFLTYEVKIQELINPVRDYNECIDELGDALVDNHWTRNLMTYNYSSFGYGYFPECGKRIKIEDASGIEHYCLCQNYYFVYDNGITESGSAETVLESDDNTFSYASITEQNTSNIEKLSNDSGWFEVDFDSSGYFAHYSPQNNKKLLYRKYGKLVEIRGAAKATQELSINGGNAEYTIGTIDYAPSADCELAAVCHGSGKAIWRCLINNSGEIILSRYRDETGYINIPNNAWLGIHITFLLG